MSDKDLKTKPHHHKGQAGFWWYEEPGGIAVVVEFATKYGIKQRVVTIPWRSLRAALARKDKP